MLRKQPSIPLDVFEAIMASQRAHEERVVILLGEFLKDVADKYDRALNPPPLAPSTAVNMSYGHLHVSEDEEDINYARDTKTADPELLRQALARLNLDTTNLEF